MALLDCVIPAFSQQSQEPVYTYGPFWYGGFVCEFAENGTRNEEMEDYEPFVQNGKLYFIAIAQPKSNGKLRDGFEFILSEDYRTSGVYKGRQTNQVNSADTVFVAGFAEKGKITITNIFPDDESLEKWADTVKLAE
jgi:hypothetical protein